MEVNSGVVFARSVRRCYEINKRINNAKVGIVDFWDFELPRKILKVITVNLLSCKSIVEQLEFLPVDAIVIDGTLHEYEGKVLDYIMLSDNPEGLFEMLKLKK